MRLIPNFDAMEAGPKDCIARGEDSEVGISKKTS